VGPLNISVKGEYALNALLDLALHNDGRPVKIAAIARRQRIPQKFLELILAGLKQGGFVISRRGADGGYMLARPADQITVGEVLRFVEGPRAAKTAAKRKADSAFASMWKDVDAAVSRILDNTTFGQLAREWREKQAAYIPNWEI